MKDPFSYSARWNSIGLDCSYCVHFRGPASWPDIQGVSRCAKHDLPLAACHASDGYRESEWFCRDFESGGRVLASSLREFESVRQELLPDVLYRGYGRDKTLVEVKFDAIRSGSLPKP